MSVRNSLAAPEEQRHDDAGRRAARLLHPAAGCRVEPLDTDALTDIAVGLAQTVEPLSDTDGAVLDRRRLLATDRYDVWLVRWAPGAAAELHDHAGSVGVVHVLDGTLLEASRPLADDEATYLRLPAGSTAAFGVDQVHALSNPGPGEASAIQVFSPPLGED